MNIVKEYKQYFTPRDLADFMVNLIPVGKVNTVIDLSMGECGLLESAKKRWEDASFLGVDIDGTLLEKIHEKCPYIHTFSGDGLGDTVKDWDEYENILNSQQFDVAIANPPFNFFNQESLSVDGDDMTLPIEMRFLLKYIEIVRDGGYICIILPYGFLSLDLYEDLRQNIFRKVTIHKVIKIFENCFDRIDADTCLLLLQKKKHIDMSIQDEVSMEYLNSQYILEKHTNINIANGKNRLDFEYHQLINDFQAIQQESNFPIIPLEEFAESCKRGRTLAKKKDLITDNGIRFLHTTDVKHLSISNDSPVYVLSGIDYFKNSEVRPDSILIGRVGRACIGKIAIVPDYYHTAVISDCIFSLNVRNIDPYYLTLYLGSKYGQMQLKGLAKGSCSKYITKHDLLKLMIIVPDTDIQMYFKKKYHEIILLPKNLKQDILLENLISEIESTLGKG